MINPQQQIPLALRAASLTLHRQSDAAFAPYDVTADQFVLLATLSEDEPSSTELSPTDDNRLELSLVPEITLDKSLETHQQEAQDKQEQSTVRANDDSASSTEQETAAERQQRVESLAARFSTARSLEDVVDDVAAETLFGEEFSQIAAAVSAMNDHDISNGSGVQLDDDENDEAHSKNSSENIDPRAMEAVSPPQEIREEAAGGDSPSDPLKDQKGSAPAAPKPASDAPVVDPENSANMKTSAAERLEMVRALNLKVGKPMPDVPSDRGEDIVLGRGNGSRKPSTSQPAPLENQFGLSMTAKLRALSAENIQQMQEAEAQQEKKSGLLRRFKRS